jgi:hypothetical protein
MHSRDRPRLPASSPEPGEAGESAQGGEEAPPFDVARSTVSQAPSVTDLRPSSVS